MTFQYRDGILCVATAQGMQPLTQWTKSARTPFYLYSKTSIAERLKWYRDSFPNSVRIRFAVKANPFLPVLKEIALAGAGADVVSGGEVERAREAGIPAEQIVFSGVAKSAQELKSAIDMGIGMINVESLEEIQRLAELARGKKKNVPVAIRVNPDIRVSTHAYISTGEAINKFGIDRRQLPRALELLQNCRGDLQLIGLAIHLGSQILDTEPMVKAVRWLRTTATDLAGEGWPIQTLDIGGGIGIDYQTGDEGPDQSRLKKYGAEISKVLSDFKGEVIVEPGRFLVARAGALLTQVEYVKQTPERCFVIVNSGMNHLLRPALYEAEHRILPVNEAKSEAEITCDIVGPICESSDVLGSGRKLRRPQAGDWLAILDTGAYGFSMASSYNLRPMPEQLLV